MNLRALFEKQHERYIRLDGTGWHAGGLSAHFQSAAVRTTATSMATMTGLHLLHGLADATDIFILGVNMAFIGICGLHARTLDQSITSPAAFWNSFNGYAIDTEGRAFPPKNEPALLQDVARVRRNAGHSLQKVLPVSAGMSVVFGAVAGLSPIAFFPILAMAPLFVRDALLIKRCDKLLHKDHIYRFAANPPPEPERQRSTAPANAKPGFF